MSQTNQTTPPEGSGAPGPEVYSATPVVTQNTKVQAAVKWVQSRARTIILVLIVAMVVVMLGRGCTKNTTVPQQNLGLDRKASKQSAPTDIKENVADKIKERDAKNFETLVGNEEAIKKGTSYMPELTNEFADPLAEYASSNSGYRSEPSKAAQAMEIDLPPQPAPPSISGAAQLPDTGGNTQPEAFTANYGAGGNEQVAGNGVSRAEMLRNHWIALKSGSNETKRVKGGMSPTLVSSAQATPQSATATSTSPTNAAQQPATNAQARAQGGPLPPLIVPLGTTLYASNAFLAHSERSKFIQATVLGGPLKGAVFQGSFERRGEILEMQYRRASWRGKTYTVDALAVNPDQPEVGLATEVNNRYLLRFGGFFLSRFLAGVGAELAREGVVRTENISPSGAIVTGTPERSNRDLAVIGLGDTMGAVSQVFAKNLDLPPIVIVAADTPLGILFRDDWRDNPGTSPQGSPAPNTTPRSTTLAGR